MSHGNPNAQQPQPGATPPMAPLSVLKPFSLFAVPFLGGALLMQRAIDQMLVMKGYFEPPQYTRLGAFAATLKFQPGQIGSGTNSAIQLINSLAGNFGQATIGNYFNLPIVQFWMSKMQSNTLANRAVAGGEHSTWCNVLDGALHQIRNLDSPFRLTKQMLSDLAGGTAGSRASVNFRAALVQRLTSVQVMTGGRSPYCIALMTGAVGAYGMVGSVRYLIDFSAPQGGAFDGASDSRIEEIE